MGRRPKFEIAGFGSYCNIWGKTRKGAEMNRGESWCYVGAECPDAKDDEDGNKWAYCRTKGPAYTVPINGKFPLSFGNSLEYKCWPGYTLDGSAGGRTKITSTVNAMGVLHPGLPEKCHMITFSICGYARDARNAAGIGGMTIEASGKSTTSAANGFYLLQSVPAGTTTLKISGGNYITVEKDFILDGDTPCEGVGSIKLSPKMANNEWRAVLSWGRRPSDLDTHIYWGTRKTLWYSRGTNWGYGLGVTLEKDDVSSYGPETTFFRGVGSCGSTPINCDLTYKIYDYGRGGIIKSGSGASVILYHGDHVEGEFKVADAPDAAISSDKNWWHVFTIDGKTNKLKYSSSPAGGFLQTQPQVTPMNGTGYDGLGPFPRRKWKRRSQRDPKLAEVRRAFFQHRRSTRTTVNSKQKNSK